jgi:hypothetical protein
MMEFSATAPAKSSRPISHLLWFHQRFGKPQVYALTLLAAFAGQCLWLAARTPVTNSEMAYLSPEHMADTNNGVAADTRESVSPLVALLAGSATFFSGEIDSPLWRMLLRTPFILIGALLGASVWYVSRRLYGNAGGYITLSLYAFSPPLIQRWAAVEPDVIAAWGLFGCIFTGIAVAHTLYAPREVVLWNWRRIMLLGVAIGLGVAAVPTTAVGIPVALGFMFYLVPHRRGAAVGILTAASVLGFIVMLATFSFSWSGLVSFLHNSGGLHLTSASLGRGVFRALAEGFFLRNGPAFATLLAVSAGVWLGWRKTRFFGTAAPLIVAVVLVVVALLVAHRDVLVFLEMVLPFLFVFVAGVCADLLELRSTYAGIVKGLILATVISNALFSISGLLRM